MKILFFKIQQNRTINENLTFDGVGGEARGLQKIVISIIIGKHMQMYCFKF